MHLHHLQQKINYLVMCKITYNKDFVSIFDLFTLLSHYNISFRRHIDFFFVALFSGIFFVIIKRDFSSFHLGRATDSLCWFVNFDFCGIVVVVCAFITFNIENLLYTYADDSPRLTDAKQFFLFINNCEAFHTQVHKQTHTHTHTRLNAMTFLEK